MDKLTDGNGYINGYKMRNNNGITSRCANGTVCGLMDGWILNAFLMKLRNKNKYMKYGIHVSMFVCGCVCID